MPVTSAASRRKVQEGKCAESPFPLPFLLILPASLVWSAVTKTSSGQTHGDSTELSRNAQGMRARSEIHVVVRHDRQAALSSQRLGQDRRKERCMATTAGLDSARRPGEGMHAFCDNCRIQTAALGAQNSVAYHKRQIPLVPSSPSRPLAKQAPTCVAGLSL